MTRDPVSFARECSAPPSVTSICAELAGVIDRPDSSTEEITAVLGKDPGLAARVLRLVNSVVYGCVAQVTTLEQAVQLIGLNQTRDLVIASSIIAHFENVPSELINVPAFWRHSQLCGTAAALLAKHLNVPEPERFYVGGLLHDLGRLMLVLEAPQEAGIILDRIQEQGELSSTVERHVLGFDHAMLGAELMTTWQLPKALANTVRCHHNPAQGAISPLDVFIVHYADFITTILDHGDGGELFVSPLVVPKGLGPYVLEDEPLRLLLEELEGQCAPRQVECVG